MFAPYSNSILLQYLEFSRYKIVKCIKILYPLNLLSLMFYVIELMIHMICILHIVFRLFYLIVTAHLFLFSFI